MCVRSNFHIVPNWTLIQQKITLVLAAIRSRYLVQQNYSQVIKNPHLNLCQIPTLESGIIVAPGINIAPGTFGKNIKRSP